MEQNIKKSLPVIMSNLQKAADKQQNYKAAEIFGGLSEKFFEPGTEVGPGRMEAAVTEDISLISDLTSLAVEAGDRGAQRALVWGRKVAAIQKSLIDRYLSKGEGLLEGKSLFICEACGFIFLGNDAPDICPVCKAPASRFSKAGR